MKKKRKKEKKGKRGKKREKKSSENDEKSDRNSIRRYKLKNCHLVTFTFQIFSSEIEPSNYLLFPIFHIVNLRPKTAQFGHFLKLQ